MASHLTQQEEEVRKRKEEREKEGRREVKAACTSFSSQSVLRSLGLKTTQKAKQKLGECRENEVLINTKPIQSQAA